MSSDSAVREAALEAFDISWARSAAIDAIHEVQNEMTRPSVIFRPKLSQDGNMWCALYGENLHDGFAAFGRTPDEAMREFDRGWARQPAQVTGYKVCDEATQDAALFMNVSPENACRLYLDRYKTVNGDGNCEARGSVFSRLHVWKGDDCVLSLPVVADGKGGVLGQC